MRLFLLHLRRGLHPGLGLMLLAVALFVGFGSELPEAVGLGAKEPLAILRGLRRADLLMAMLSVLIPLSTAQALRTWSQKEGRERAWLLSSRASKGKLVLCAWAGNWGAALLWLLCVTLLCESLSGPAVSHGWRAAGALEMREVQREGPEGHLTWNCNMPPSTAPMRVQFEVGLFGSDADLDEFVLSSFEADGEPAFDMDTSQPARISILEVAVPTGQSHVSFKLATRGATRSLLLNKPRLQLFVATASSLPIWLFMGRVALLLAVAQALALGFSAWFSGATSLAYVFSAYLLVWLEGERWSQTAFEAWLPGFDLPVALDWIAQGRGPGPIALQSWLGALALVALGLSSVLLGLRRWRTGR